MKISKRNITDLERSKRKYMCRQIITSVAWILVLVALVLFFAFGGFSKTAQAANIHPVKLVAIVCEKTYDSIIKPPTDLEILTEIKRQEKIKERQEKEYLEALERQRKQEEYNKYISSFKNIGTFKLSYYCPCARCNGNTRGITASGAKLKPGVSIAVDRRVIPLGSKVLIDGREYVAHDTGGAIKGNRIDVCVSSHAEALKLGRTTATVYVKK